MPNATPFELDARFTFTKITVIGTATDGEESLQQRLAIALPENNLVLSTFEREDVGARQIARATFVPPQTGSEEPRRSAETLIRPVHSLTLLVFLGFTACKAPQPSNLNNHSSAFDSAAKFAARATKEIQGNFEVSTRTAHGGPGIFIKFGVTEPDYDSAVKSISENSAVRSFDGELRIWYETQTELADRAKAPLSWVHS